MRPVDTAPVIPHEQVLRRQLSAARQAMMALGGAIGTGLFLATGLSVDVAGPAIILSYAIAARVSLPIGRAITEMAVAHPTAGDGPWMLSLLARRSHPRYDERATRDARRHITAFFDRSLKGQGTS